MAFAFTPHATCRLAAPCVLAFVFNTTFAGADHQRRGGANLAGRLLVSRISAAQLACTDSAVSAFAPPIAKSSRLAMNWGQQRLRHGAQQGSRRSDQSMHGQAKAVGWHRAGLLCRKRAARSQLLAPLPSTSSLRGI